MARWSPCWRSGRYTLLPLPDPDAIRCAGVNVDVTVLADEVSAAVARRGGAAATDPAVAQLLLNVLLFVPLGFFIRVLGGRGVATALAVGLALSGIIELTQFTGVWGLYPCAYRVFDVGDLLDEHPRSRSRVAARADRAAAPARLATAAGRR